MRRCVGVGAGWGGVGCKLWVQRGGELGGVGVGVGVGVRVFLF